MANNKLFNLLLDWAVTFVKNKDIITKKIEKITKNNDGFTVKKTDSKDTFIVVPFIHDFNQIIQKLNKEDSFIIVVLNSKENFDIIIRNWDKLIDFNLLTIVFANPFSRLEKKWMLKPYFHNIICDNTSLKKGLSSMFEMVEPVVKEEVNSQMRDYPN